MNNASLTSIPTGKPTNLTELILSHNSVAMSDSDIEILRKYPGIRVLDLSYNHIQSLPEGAFHSLTHLETLNLRGNELKTLHKDIFKGLIKLKSLDLEENPWNCSCSLTSLIKHLNESGVSAGENESLRCSPFSDMVFMLWPTSCLFCLIYSSAKCLFYRQRSVLLHPRENSCPWWKLFLLKSSPNSED